MAQYNDPDLFLFLDESAINNLSTQHFAGWSPCGTPCVWRATFIRGAHYSMLPALTIDGIVALDIFEGAVNQEIFVRFLCEQIVSYLLLLQSLVFMLLFRHQFSTHFWGRGVL